MRFDDTTARRLLVALGLGCLAVFAVTAFLPHSDGHLLGSDGRDYYAILRSLVFDRDFNFANEYEYVGYAPKPLTVTGLPAGPYAIGTPVLWLPFFLAGHLVSLALHAAGMAVPLDGFGYVYEAAVCVATICYATAGLLLAYHVARRLFDVEAALPATLAMWAATPAVYYTVAEPSMSHALSFFAVALFLAAWVPLRPESAAAAWARAGLAAGLVALVRWQDGVIAAVPAVSLAVWVLGRRVPPAAAVRHAAAYVACAVLVFVPQMVMWSALYGTPLTIPQGDDFFRWLAPEPLATLFSTRHGLITWHPMFAVALLGLVPLWRYDRRLALAVLGIFLVQLYINSAAARWWADDAFGGRRFTGLVALLVLPCAALLQAARQRSGVYRGLLALCAFLVVWNGLGMVQYVFSLVPRGDALTWEQLTLDRLALPLRLWR